MWPGSQSRRGFRSNHGVINAEHKSNSNHFPSK